MPFRLYDVGDGAAGRLTGVDAGVEPEESHVRSSQGEVGPFGRFLLSQDNPKKEYLKQERTSIRGTLRK
jgi:hypothetical protein